MSILYSAFATFLGIDDVVIVSKNQPLSTTNCIIKERDVIIKGDNVDF